jgi:type IV pilus assembly protein PilA
LSPSPNGHDEARLATVLEGNTKMLARIRKAKEENEGGFTLIELLVVVVIIGILAAVAIPTFLNQREKAWERAALSDLRNNSVKIEEYFSDNGLYPTQAQVTASPANNYTVKLSEGVSVTTVTGGGTTTGYCIEVAHAKLSGITFALDSATGKALKNDTC